MDCGTIKGPKYVWRVLWDEYTHEVWVRETRSGRTEYVGKASSAREAVAKADTYINYN
jgi:hypothetical protein